MPLFCALVLASLPLLAKDLNVATSCEELTCTLSPVSLPLLLKFANNNKEALKVFETYTPVLVSIKSNLNHNVYLNQDCYLHGLEEAFVPRDVFVETINSSGAGKIVWNTVFGAFWGYLAYIFGRGIVHNAQNNDWVSAIIGCLITATVGGWSLSDILQLPRLVAHGDHREVQTFEHAESNVVRSNDTFTDLFFIKKDALPENFWEEAVVELNYNHLSH